MSDPGEFVYPVTITSEHALGAAVSGGFKKAAPATVVALTWAKITPNTSGRFRVAGMDQGQVSHLVTLSEWFASVAKGMTINTEDGRALTILGPPVDMDGTKTEMVLFASEVLD